MSAINTKVTFCGWFAFEGFGRPFEAWSYREGHGWQAHGRAFTYRGARRKAKRGALARRHREP